jgi:hypothetical protein
VAIHFYGATEAEKQELERAAERDEELEKQGQIIGLDEKGGLGTREVELSPSHV